MPLAALRLNGRLGCGVTLTKDVDVLVFDLKVAEWAAL